MFTVRTKTVVPPLIELAAGCYKSVYAYLSDDFEDLEDHVKEMWMTIADSVLKDLGLEPDEDMNSPQMQALKKSMSKKSMSKKPRQKRRAVSDEEMYKVVRLYESGMSQVDIGKAHGRTPGTIHQILKKYERKTGKKACKGSRNAKSD